MNIKEALKFSRDFLGAEENTSLNGEVLLMHALGVSKEYLFAHGDKDIDENLLVLFENYLQRLRDGEPVAYVTNEKEFFGLDFYVDKRVLMPRPETEELVQIVLGFLKASFAQGEQSFRLLDVGTGSGNIPVAICKQFESVEEEVIDQFDAIDVSEEALQVARINIEQNSLSEKIALLHSDLLDELEEGEEYDVITANLPYIATDEDKKFLAANVEKNEPSLALFAGADGLDLYRRLFQQIAEKPVIFRFFIGEFGFGQTAVLQELLDEYFEGQWEIVKDLAGIERFFIVRR